MIEDYRNQIGAWVKHIPSRSGPINTRAGQIWKNMFFRCKEGSESQKRSPTYIGCTMSEKFKDFQFFAEWCQTQIGYGLDGYEIDKDILIPGNKVYSEDACVFVPSSLNKFTNNHSGNRGAYPLGVSFQKGAGIRADLRVDSKNLYLGLFDTVKEASNAYLLAKRKEALRWAARLESKEFIVDVRVIEALRSWNRA